MLSGNLQQPAVSQSDRLIYWPTDSANSAYIHCKPIPKHSKTLFSTQAHLHPWGKEQKTWGKEECDGRMG